jgi:hypothetical protein
MPETTGLNGPRSSSGPLRGIQRGVVCLSFAHTRLMFPYDRPSHQIYMYFFKRAAGKPGAFWTPSWSWNTRLRWGGLGPTLKLTPRCTPGSCIAKAERLGAPFV